MKNLFLIVFIILNLPWTQLFSQDITQTDSINYELEREEINSFILKFLSESDTLALQAYFLFPYLNIGPYCGDDFSYFGIKNQNFSDKEIRKIADADTCETPLYYWELKYSYNEKFKKSLQRKDLHILEYYYSSKSNQYAMSKYIINKYHFGLFASLNDSISSAKSYSTNALHQHRIFVCDIRFDNLLISIIKINNAYKIYALHPVIIRD